MSIQKVVDFIHEHHTFLITTHTNMEGDALGSQLAFARLLKALGKHAVMVSDDHVPCGYEFLPDTQSIKKYTRALKDVKFDALVAVDCSDLKRTGEVYTLNRENKPILNIDHHISNVRFGTVNWVDAHASSCTQMLYLLYKKMRVPLNKDTALLLYVGIMTDTGSFRYSNTKSATHAIVSALLEFPLDVPWIYKNIYENIPFKDMVLLSKILPTMRMKFQGKLVWNQISQGVLRQQQRTSFDLSEHVLSFERAIEGAQVVVLFKENLKTTDQIRINFRSQGRIDVNEIARAFGGGGHRTASGCTVKGQLEPVKKRVFARIKKALLAL